MMLSRLICWFLPVAAAVLAYLLSGVASRLLRIAVHRPETSPDAVRFGLLGAAKIAPHGLLFPALMVESATVVAVGARDPARAAQLASKWGIQRSGDYNSVLNDPSVEAVYIPLLNGLHYEWAAAALRAGKHVLCEKPLTSNAAEAVKLAEIVELSMRRSEHRMPPLVLLEAFHWRYHPLAARLRALVGEEGELGRVLELEVGAGMPTPDSLKARLGLGGGSGSPKMDAGLGGGNFMGQVRRLHPLSFSATTSTSTTSTTATTATAHRHRTPPPLPKTQNQPPPARHSPQGCYAVSVARHLLGEPTRVLNASMQESAPGSRADVATRATLLFADGVAAGVTAPGPGLRPRHRPGLGTARASAGASACDAAPRLSAASRRHRDAHLILHAAWRPRAPDQPIGARIWSFSRVGPVAGQPPPSASTCAPSASAARCASPTTSSPSCTTRWRWRPPRARRAPRSTTAAARPPSSCSCAPSSPPCATTSRTPPRRATPSRT